MNLNITNKELIINNKTHKIEDIDFILCKGKIRIYKNNGTVCVVSDNYSKEEKQLVFLDIACSIASINKNFLLINNACIINLSNVKSIQPSSLGSEILTQGFNLQLEDISEEHKQIITNKTKTGIVLL